MLYDRDDRINKIIHAFRELVIGVSQSKYAWLDDDSDRKIVISCDLKDEVQSLILEFQNPVAVDKLNIRVMYAAGGPSDYAGSMLNTENNATYILNLDRNAAPTEVIISHNYGAWLAWKYFYIKVYAKTKGNNEQDVCLYDSTSLFSHMKLLLSDLQNLGMASENIHELSELIDSATFTSDWTSPKSKTISLFDATARAISPYTVGAHGVTVPLATQGMDTITARIPKIVSNLNSLGVPWFCTSGTLLGLVRENKFIDYDDDLDFVFYVGEVGTPEELMYALDEIREKLVAIAMPGMNALQYKMKGHVGAVDIFVSWSDSDENMWIYPWCGGAIKYRDIFPLSQLSIGTSHLNAPNNPVHALEINYGQHWNIPDPLWRFDWAQSNIVFNEYLNSTKEFFIKFSA